MLERELAAEITRWWEAEAERVADCAKPDPALCSNHVFEEAVRVDGEIVACTVHGGRLAESLAAHLVQVGKEYEERLKLLALEGTRRLAEGIGLPPELIFRQERMGTWPNPPYCVPGCDFGITGYHAKRGGRVLCQISRHRQGCGAATDMSKRCICGLTQQVESEQQP